MKLDYMNCTVRLGGNLLHEVGKENVSNLELKVLRKIHGNDAVVNVQRISSKEADELEEAYRLARIYGKKVVEDTLKVSLDDFEDWMQLQMEEEQRQRDEAAKKRQEDFQAQQREKLRAQLAEASKGAEIQQQQSEQSVTT